MAGNLLQLVALGATFTGRVSGQRWRSHGIRMPPSMLAMLLSHPVRMSAFVGLRSVHSFAITPVSNSRSTVASYKSSRRGRCTRFVTRSMFERFTEKAIKVIMLAQEEARRLGHNFVGTEQILWAFPLGEAMSGVITKFAVTSMVMWMAPVAIMYGFYYQIFPGVSQLSSSAQTLASGFLAVISVNLVIGFYICMAMKETPHQEPQPDPTFLANAKASINQPTSSQVSEDTQGKGKVE